MQPERTGSGLPNESLLYQSLKPYLDTPTRQQPIIGLDSVTECVKLGSCSQEALYLCEVCQSRMKRSDVRNHIMGSLHRYRYINARHPDLAVGWGQTVDVSKLAWPLMEMASVLEKRDGPGIVKVLQLDAFTFKEMGQKSAASAVSQMAAIRCEQMERRSPHPSELTQTHVDNGGVQPWRVQSSPKKCPVKSRNTAVQRTKASVPLQTNKPMSDADKTTLKLPLAKSFVQSESRGHILDGHMVIGLDCVVECRRTDNGSPSCFLCQCCCVKSDPDDFIAHLTSSSHISNYLMEVYPECVEAMMGGLNGEKELLQSVALRVENIEGRGEHKVLEWPTHLCDQLSDKTYHWCIQMFSDSEQSMSAARQKNTIRLKGLDAFHQLTTLRDAPEAGSEWAAKKRRTRKETDPVFKVSMPMSEGAFVLERASFSLPNSAAVSTPSSPPPDTVALEPQAREPLASYSNVDFSPLTVTLFETPHLPLADSLPRQIEVRCTDVEETIPVVIGRRAQTEFVPGWALPTQGSRTETYKPSPSHDFYPQENLQFISDAETCVVQHDSPQASGAGPPADGISQPGSGFTGACAVTSRTLPSRPLPVFHDDQPEMSLVGPKPTVTFYYCTPGGQRRS